MHTCTNKIHAYTHKKAKHIVVIFMVMPTQLTCHMQLHSTQVLRVGATKSMWSGTGAPKEWPHLMDDGMDSHSPP